jgi:hypothetical protein
MRKSCIERGEKGMQWKNGLAFLMVAGLFAGAYAFMGNGAARDAIAAGDYEAWKAAVTDELTEERFNQIAERHRHMHQYREQVHAAIEAGDYEAWKAAMDQMQGPRITDLVTEENFDLFMQMHIAKQNGDYETANQLREQLGIEAGFGKMKGSGFGKFGMHRCGQPEEGNGLAL